MIYLGLQILASMTEREAMTEDRTSVPPLLDHIVVATPTLEATVAEFERSTGVSPDKGGSHESLGTRNYLVTFGGGHYLEIVGAVESLPHPDGPYPFDLDTIATATVATWAIHPDDADATVTRANTAGIPISPLEALSRRTPDGALLSWRLTQPTAGPLPFIIDWQDSVSPAASTQARAELRRFTLCVPQSEGRSENAEASASELRMQLAALGTAIETETCACTSDQPRLCLEVSGPAGIWTV